MRGDCLDCPKEGKKCGGYGSSVGKACEMCGHPPASHEDKGKKNK